MRKYLLRRTPRGGADTFSSLEGGRAPRRSSLGAREPDVVPAHDVVDAEERGGVLAVNAIMPIVVDLFVRDGQERRVVLQNLLGLTHHGLAPALVHLALTLAREIVEGRVRPHRVVLRAVLPVPGPEVVGPGH